jgi:hypothetical protein
MFLGKFLCTKTTLLLPGISEKLESALGADNGISYLCLSNIILSGSLLRIKFVVKQPVVIVSNNDTESLG